MTRKTRPDIPNAFARMTAALKVPPAANAELKAPERQPKAELKAPPAPKASTRINTKIVAGHFPEPMHRALRIAGAEEGLTMQQILEDALNDWLVKKGATKHLNR
jgi:hypothetical protein